MGEHLRVKNQFSIGSKGFALLQENLALPPTTFKPVGMEMRLMKGCILKSTCLASKQLNTSFFIILLQNGGYCQAKN